MSGQVRVLTGRYVDSVILMRLAERLGQSPGIQDAAAVMGTEANKTLLREGGFTVPPGAAADDLVIAVKATGEAEAAAGLAQVETLLASTAVPAGRVAARTLEQALSIDPDINIAAISLPGEYAAGEARAALEHGLHVFLFSSNVPLAEEVALKQLAGERGLLCMGPDCGTAIIHGKGLGFANAVRPGPIGLVGAAGTGLQAVVCYLDKLGVGISHAIGCGSRDLSGEVGGATMLAGLEALLPDPATEAIVLISKPPAPAVARRVRQRAAAAHKPVICWFGDDATTLDAAASLAAEAVGATPASDSTAVEHQLLNQLTARMAPLQTELRALYAGGTLAYEAQLILRNRGVDLDSHTILDMGGEEFTHGRPHPMIDARARKARLLQEAGDPAAAVVLLDFVLGYGAAQDPVGDLADAITAARTNAADAGRELAVLAFVCGTERDPQDLAAQQERLRELGVIVLPTNAAMVETAAELIALREHPSAVTAAAGGV